MAEHAGILFRCTIDDGNGNSVNTICRSRKFGKVGLSGDILLGCFIPYCEKYFLQNVYCRAFNADMHITPCTNFGESVDVIICYIHSSGIAYFSVDNNYFPMIPVCCVVDIGKLKRIEFDYFDAPFADCFEMTLLQWLIIRPVAESIE